MISAQPIYLIICNSQGLMDFSGPKKLVYLSGPKYGSTKVLKLVFALFEKTSGLQWTQKPDILGPLKYTSLFLLTLKKLVYFSGPMKRKFLSFRRGFFCFVGPLKCTRSILVPNWTQCTLVDPHMENYCPLGKDFLVLWVH